LSSLPALFMNSGVQTFNSLQQIFSVLNTFLLFFSGGLGLFIMSSHLRGRNLKMVFTKPCSPALWLASAFLAAVAVALLLYFIVVGSGGVFFLVWVFGLGVRVLVVLVVMFVCLRLCSSI